MGTRHDIEPYSRTQDKVSYTAYLKPNPQIENQVDAYSTLWHEQCLGSTNNYFWELVWDEINDYLDMLPNRLIMVDQYGPNGLTGRLYLGSTVMAETIIRDPKESLVQVEDGQRMNVHLHYFGAEGSLLIPKGSIQSIH